MQQVLAFESDLLEYDDLFEGSVVVQAKVADLVDRARAEIDRVQQLGGAVAAVESGYMKGQLVAAHAARRARIESGDEIVVGVNAFTSTEPSPLTADLATAVESLDPAVISETLDFLQLYVAQRAPVTPPSVQLLAPAILGAIAAAAWHLPIDKATLDGQ